MPSETILDGMINWGNTIMRDTMAQEQYDQFAAQYTEYDFEALDDLYKEEIETVLLKCFKDITGKYAILEQSPPLVQALVYRRLKIIFDRFADKRLRVMSRSYAILMHLLFVEWYYVRHAVRQERLKASAPSRASQDS